MERFSGKICVFGEARLISCNNMKNEVDGTTIQSQICGDETILILSDRWGFTVQIVGASPEIKLQRGSMIVVQ